MKALRPKSITVFAILNFVFGGLGLLYALFSIVVSMNLSITGGSAQTSAILLVSAMLSIVVGTLAILSGIGLIKVASWGRGCTLAYGLVAMIGAFLYIGVMLAIHFPNGNNTQISDAKVMTCVWILIGGALRFLYALVLLLYLRSSKWKEAFAARRIETAVQ